MTSPHRERIIHLLEKWEFGPRQAVAAAKKSTVWTSLFEYWLRFAKILGKANALVLLTVVYFLVIGPGAILLKLLRKDLLDRGAESNSSYWYDKAHVEQGLDRSTHQF